ncbi:MAG: GNAT family N-acetyltransferase [Dokdonella sp.]
MTTSTIRPARAGDARVLAELCGQLGYPATRQQISARLAAIEAKDAGCILVAENPQGRLLGWLHVTQAETLTAGSDAEILGLVVGEDARGNGVGTKLLNAAQDLARSRGLANMRVRSRAERERAHRFYQRAGFEHIKNQAAFRKSLQ